MPKDSKRDVSPGSKIQKAHFLMDVSARPSSLETGKSQPFPGALHTHWAKRALCSPGGKMCPGYSCPSTGIGWPLKASALGERWRGTCSFCGETLRICHIVLALEYKVQTVLGSHRETVNDKRAYPLAYTFTVNCVLEMCVYLLFLLCFWSTSSEGSNLNKGYLTE